MTAGDRNATNAHPSRRVTVRCPECEQSYRVAERLLGRRLLCRHCRHEWRATAADGNGDAPADVNRAAGSNDLDTGSSGQSVLPDDISAAGGSSTIVDTSWSGRRLGRYRVLSLLGKGGMGVVWRAHDDTLRRDVALKILSSGGRAADKMRKEPGLNVDLFMQEARAVAKLQHPSVVSIFEVAEDQGAKFLALELMDGGTLKEYVDRHGPVPPRELFELMVGPARALSAAHRRDIVHRDIKPSNFMFDDHGHLKLGDFGLADVAHEDASARLQGRAVGSLGWVAPETARGEPTTAASDVYGMGLVMLYALRGRPWLNAKSRTRLLAMHKDPPEPDFSDISGLTPAGAELLRRCLAVSPADRFESADRLSDALRACANVSVEHPKPHRRSPLLVSVVIVAFAVLAAFGWGLWYASDYFGDRIEQLRQPAARPGDVTPKPAPATQAAQPTTRESPRSQDASSAERPWPEAMDRIELKFLASRHGRVFHKPDCDGGRQIHLENLVLFDSVKNAAASRRTPCPQCRPGLVDPR